MRRRNPSGAMLPLRATLWAAVLAAAFASTAHEAQAQPETLSIDGDAPCNGCPLIPLDNFPQNLALVQAQGNKPKVCVAPPESRGNPCNVNADCDDPPASENGDCHDPDAALVLVNQVLQKSPQQKIAQIANCNAAVTAIQLDRAAKGNPFCIDVAIYGHGGPGSMKVGEDDLERDTVAAGECIEKIIALAPTLCSLTLVGCEVGQGVCTAPAAAVEEKRTCKVDADCDEPPASGNGMCDPVGQDLVDDLFAGLGVPIKVWNSCIQVFPKQSQPVPTPFDNAMWAEEGSKKKTPIKTWPLAESQFYWIRLSNHIPFAPPWANYAGAILKVHILDNQELDVTGFHPRERFRTPMDTGPFPASMNVPSPFGPPSSNLQSSPISLTFWNAQASMSGVPVKTSQLIPLATFDLHAKSTYTVNNSDTDLTFEGWNIWHILAGTGSSTLVRLKPSDRIWVNSTITMQDQLHTTSSLFSFPPSGPTPFYPNAHWLHLTKAASFHLSPGPGSAFYATFVNQVGLGIEHVPEPGRELLIVSGILGLALGGRLRRRRMA